MDEKELQELLNKNKEERIKNAWDSIQKILDEKNLIMDAEIRFLPNNEIVRLIHLIPKEDLK